MIIETLARSDGSYVAARTKDKNKIRELLAEGHEPIYYNNWLMINGITFNGFTKEQIEKLDKAFCIKCNCIVDISIKKEQKVFEDVYEGKAIKVKYIGKKAVCRKCGEEIYDDEVAKYNIDKIKKAIWFKYADKAILNGKEGERFDS